MTGWGVLLPIIGIGALSMMGMQFKIISIFGAAAPFAAGGLAVLGGILIFVG